MDVWVWYLIGSVPLLVGGAVLTIAGIRWTRRPSAEQSPELRRAGEPDPNDPNAAARSAIGRSSWTLTGGGGV